MEGLRGVGSTPVKCPLEATAAGDVMNDVPLAGDACLTGQYGTWGLRRLMAHLVCTFA